MKSVYSPFLMKPSSTIQICFFSVLLLLLLAPAASAQRPTKTRGKAANATAAVYDSVLYNGLRWRSIGPYRGGRAGTVTGVLGNPNLYYMGSAGSGVWRTIDGGGTWANITDKYFGGSIGAVAVSESDPNVIYAGQGEQTVRGNVSSGFGVWKSQDAGKTWANVGLKDSRHIGRIRIHPKNPDLVYVAAMGNLYIPGEMRGDASRIFDFCAAIVDATRDLVIAFKPQIAYFAAHRAEEQLERLIAHIHATAPDVPVILDAKRGDMGSTAEQYAKEVFDRYRADAVTLSPLLASASRKLRSTARRSSRASCGSSPTARVRGLSGKGRSRSWKPSIIPTIPPPVAAKFRSAASSISSRTILWKCPQKNGLGLLRVQAFG